MKSVFVMISALLLLICPLILRADKLPRVAYFNIPKGRVIQSQTAIDKLGGAKGVVAVNFVMNKKGKVISAMADAKHTTVNDKAFINQVVKAVLAMKFNNYKNGPEAQNGSLAYVFN